MSKIASGFAIASLISSETSSGFSAASISSDPLLLLFPSSVGPFGSAGKRSELERAGGETALRHDDRGLDHLGVLWTSERLGV